MMKAQRMPICYRPEEQGIDMHTHTSASDGFGTPEELLVAAKEKDLTAVGVTDHDALESAKWCFGYMRHLAESADEKGILMIPGIEVSSWIDLGGETHVVHILGLGIDPYDTGLEALCGRLRESHIAQLRRRLEHARELGLGLNQEAEARVLSRGCWGRAEIARELVPPARFECVHDAYCALWSNDGPHVDLDQYVHAEAAISAIHGARGLAILAHPLRREPNGEQISTLDA